jgi:hypothetical protein
VLNMTTAGGPLAGTPSIAGLFIESQKTTIVPLT